jgi:hypothetical protein
MAALKKGTLPNDYMHLLQPLQKKVNPKHFGAM